MPSGGEDGQAGSPEQAQSLSGDPIWTARGRRVSVAEGATGSDLPERVELVRAALPDADRARFEQELDQALDPARSTRRGGWFRVVFAREHGGGRRLRRGCAGVKGSSGRANRWTGGCDQPLRLLSCI
jgi:hypothetical protein